MSTKTSKLGIIMSLFVLFFTFVPTAVFADTQTFKVTKFDVAVQPEYDDPRTLVIYEGDFINPGPDTIKKGTPVNFIIPKSADPNDPKGLEIGMACEVNSSGGHDCQPYDTKDLGDGTLELSWKTSKDIAPNQKYPIFLEFYYNNGAKAPNKSFEFKFRPTYNLDALNIAVTAPAAASNFKLDPFATGTNQDGNGLTKYFLNFSNKTPKDLVLVKITYVKGDDKPSFEKRQVGNQTQQDSSSGGKSPWSSPTVLIPALLFVVVLVLLLIFALKNPKQPAPGNRNFQQVKNNKPVKKVDGSSNKGVNAEKKRLRQMLLDGKISEETYKSLLADLNDDAG